MIEPHLDQGLEACWPGSAASRWCNSAWNVNWVSLRQAHSLVTSWGLTAETEDTKCKQKPAVSSATRPGLTSSWQGPWFLPPSHFSEHSNLVPHNGASQLLSITSIVSVLISKARATSDPCFLRPLEDFVSKKTSERLTWLKRSWYIMVYICRQVL